jgi:O-antigen/teichoic acid export membrane protein
VSKSNFYKGLSLLVVLNILIKPVWIFFVDRQVQNVSGHTNYGSYFSLFSLSIVLGFIADAGITSMMNRQLAMKQPGSVNELFNYKIYLSLFYMAALVAICYYTGVHNWKMIFLVGTIQIMNSFVLFFRSVITAAQKFSTDSWISILDKLLVIAFLLPFLYAFTEQGEKVLYVFLYAQAGSLLLTLCIAGYVAGKSIQNEKETRSDLKYVLRLTMPFIILIALMGIHNRLDMFLLERMHENGPYEAGAYAAAYRLLDAGNMMGYLAASFLFPFASRHLTNLKTVSPVVLQLRHSLLNISLLAVLFCFFFAGWVINLLYHLDSDFYQWVLRLTIISLPAYMMIHIYGSLLTAAGEFKTFGRIVIISVLVNVVLNLLFITSYGAIACACAAIISQYLLGTLCYVNAVRKMNIPWAGRPFLLNIAIAFLFGILFYYLSEKQVDMLTVLVIAGIASALFMFVQTKLIRTRV